MRMIGPFLKEECMEMECRKSEFCENDFSGNSKRATGRQATHDLRIRAKPQEETDGNVSQERRTCVTIVLVEGIIMQSEDAELAALFLKFSREKMMGQFWPRLRTAVEPLTEEQVWWRPNEASNSIGNLILHLNGNARQWLVDSFNDTKDGRDRPAEFFATGGVSAGNLLARHGRDDR